MSEQILPIVLDLEASGADLVKCGVWQIGAVDLNTMEEFIDEARIDDEDIVKEDALKVIGKTEEELRDSSKQSQKELIEKFLNWAKGRKMKNIVCHHPQFDFSGIEIKKNKYGLGKVLDYKAFDTHSIAQTKFFELNNKFLIDEENHKSDMGLHEVLELCGLPDKRKIIYDGEVKQEGEAHNALEDAKMTGECFMRLMFGKNIFPEFEKFEVPEVLRK